MNHLSTCRGARSASEFLPLAVPEIRRLLIGLVASVNRRPTAIVAWLWLAEALLEMRPTNLLEAANPDP